MSQKMDTHIMPHNICRACATVEYPEFIPPDLWPPSSPDLNPVDYKIWGQH